MDVTANPFADRLIHFQPKGRTTRLYISSRELLCILQRNVFAEIMHKFRKPWVAGCPHIISVHVTPYDL